MAKTKRFTFEKLVRDKIPALLQERGAFVHGRFLEGDEYIKSLKAKMVEEAIEVQEALDNRELLSELADVFEVMNALLGASGFSHRDLEVAAHEKRLERGGFEQKFYIAEVEVEAASPEAVYYQARYPKSDKA